MLESVRLAINDVLTDSHAKVSAKVVAARLGIPLSTLYSWGETGPTGRDCPLQKLVALVAACEDARPLAALCLEAQGVFLPIPHQSGETVDAALLSVISDFGAAVKEIGADLSDGKLTAAEMSRIRKDVTETQHALAHLMYVLDRKSRRDAARRDA